MIEYFKTEAMFTSKTMRIIFWLSLNSLVVATTLTSCIDTPEERGMYSGVVKLVGTPIVKPQLLDTNIIVGDTIEVRYMDTLTLAVVVR